jgi:hypothetical protein
MDWEFRLVKLNLDCFIYIHFSCQKIRHSIHAKQIAEKFIKGSPIFLGNPIFKNCAQDEYEACIFLQNQVLKFK